MNAGSYKVCLCVLAALLPGCSSPQPEAPPIEREDFSKPSRATLQEPRLEAKLLSARLMPITTAQGKPTVEVICQWQNTGNTPIRLVKANITAYDANGSPVGNTPAQNYTIFVAQGDRSIPAGATYEDPSGEGFMIVPMPGENYAVRADVEISNVAAKSALDE